MALPLQEEATNFEVITTVTFEDGRVIVFTSLFENIPEQTFTGFDY